MNTVQCSPMKELSIEYTPVLVKKVKRKLPKKKSILTFNNIINFDEKPDLSFLFNKINDKIFLYM